MVDNFPLKKKRVMDTCPTHKEQVSQSPIWATDGSIAQRKYKI